jgi:hypothetical protein
MSGARVDEHVCPWQEKTECREVEAGSRVTSWVPVTVTLVAILIENGLKEGRGSLSFVMLIVVEVS